MLPLSSRIRWARERKGISQANLAATIHTSRRHMIRIEKGEHRPGLELRARIAAATDQPLDFFMDADDGDDEEDAALARELVAVVRRIMAHETRESARA
jgi:transcriptional regulator with XRE-family HTH domain